MKDKLARTPLDPKSTFKDDPIRALRVVRFSKQFDLNLADGISEAAQDPSIVNEISNTVAGERKKTEFDKIFEGKNAHQAIQ